MSGNSYTDAMKQLLDQLDGGDPQIRQLLEQQLQQNLQRKEGGTTKDEMLRRFRIQNKKLMEQLAMFKQQAKEIRAENAQLVQYLDYFLKLNKSLAAALGACENCWGQEETCDLCHGEGAPGWKNANKRLFNIYVRPAVEKTMPGA
jgi:hypothetical protein